MTVKHCIICGNKENITKLYPATFSESDLNRKIYSARRLPDRIHYQLNKCLSCGMVYSSPILPPGKIAGLYKNSSCNYGEQVSYITSTYMKLFNQIQDRLPKNPKILEVGCGDGFFLKALYNAGFKNVYGVEPGREMVKSAPAQIRRHIKTDIFRKNQFRPGSFDLICCFHTLDHLTDPALFAEEAFRILKPGGVVLAVTHDTEGLSVKLFGEKSPIFDIEHIYLFSKSNITEFFANQGFAGGRAFNLVNTYPLKYWLRMSGLPMGLKKIGQSFLRISGLSNLDFSLAGGNLAYFGMKPD